MNTKLMNLTRQMGPDEFPTKSGVYNAKLDGFPPRTPYLWSYWANRRWGPITKKIQDAQMEYDIEVVRDSYGYEAPERKVVWRGLAEGSK